MYKRPKFLELLLEIREEMSRNADFDVDLFAENIRSGKVFRRRRTFNFYGDEKDVSKTKKTRRGKSN
ncbi:MAG: hypothetical protein ACK5NT_07560 [Pyrinomonadaceae bacterium]